MKTKYVKANSVDDYFNIPKSERQRFGFYLRPISLPMDMLEFSSDKKRQLGGWGEWERRIREEYPIQGFFREWVLSYDNPVYAFFGICKRKIIDFKYLVKRLFKPMCPRFRKSFRRHEYKDVCDVIVDCNFALILDFWHEEVVDSPIDWESSKEYKDFYEWLKDSVRWIEIDREYKKKVLRDYLMSIDFGDKSSCKNSCMILDDAEQSIEKKDKQILTKMIQYKEFFWT